ncbi:ABC transporter protein [Halomicronema hongdechloris C2206]|uniref:ABC transporter protein n=1 Tax=Halomicronema hongdechloris C2206 TaxID=1641165 RepID=A0A1Z3HHN2_9CYAN|nr:ABC transporter ATP-binding protein [Halomicronema hongdechloris]ASC69804.1 ABC transporter protein [Halomicronema hongdechloris C2206]
MAKLKLNNLTKAYSRKVVPVKELSLSVEDNEFLTLVGPSGCGKSTILRLIAGLEQATAGQVLIGDKDITPLPPKERNIAMVFQSYALYPHMTVYENMASGLKLRGLPAGDIQKRIQDASRVLGLDELFDRRPSQLSGGQRQRVALGRALVREPEAFLLDEPLSNLDALLREQVRADLKQIFEAQRSPVVYVTHDQTEAMTLSTKVAVLSQGHLQQLGTPDAIYRKPANRFVAGFIGSPQMNLITLERVEKSVLLGDFRIDLPEGISPHPSVVMGIRPEHVRLPQPGDQQTIRGDVFLVENLGMSTLISVRIHGTDDTTLRALLPSDADWSRDNIELALPPQLLHWFNADTEERLGS